MKSSTRRKILAALPATIAELTKIVGCSRNTIKTYMPLICKEGDAHISGWIRAGAGPSSAVYATGRGDDAPRGQAPAVTHTGCRPFDTPEPTVSYAMRTQPRWIFDLAGRAA